MSLKKLLKRLISILLVLLLAISLIYTFIISPNDYTISSYEYASTAIPAKFDHFKIALFGDCNLRNSDDLERLEKMINELNEETFDIAIFSGDLYDSTPFDSEKVSAILKQVDCKYGKFAVLGEKDPSIEIEETLNEGGFEVISDTNRTIYFNDKKIALLGLNEKTADDVKKDNDLFTIAVSHNPDTFNDNYKDVDMQLSGHSCGGYFYLPFLGSIITSEGCKEYNHGTYTKNNATLIVTNGVRGTSKMPYKFLARNEIKLITFTYKSKS